MQRKVFACPSHNHISIGGQEGLSKELKSMKESSSSIQGRKNYVINQYQFSRIECGFQPK
jgi:hypothetical protein